MPNWCSNELYIGIEADRDVAAITQQIKERCAGTVENGEETVLDFRNIVQPPDTPSYRDEPDQKTAKQNYDWWYNWNVKNWGTKWNSQGARWSADDTVINFDTAWSPPLPIVLELSKLFEDVVFALRYEEGGMAFAGDYVCVNGKVHFEHTRETLPWLDGIIDDALDELSKARKTSE